MSPDPKPSAPAPAAPAAAAAEPSSAEEVLAPSAVPEAPPRPRLPFPPLFGKFTFEGVEVHDPGLKNYLYLDPVYLPHSEGRLANHPFSKTRMHVVERLANDLMKTGKFTGKKAKALKTIRDAFVILAKEPEANPLQLLVDAIENSAPREEVTRLQFGGISVPRAVDAAPARRLAVALRNLAQGAIQASKGPGVSISDALAKEILLASKGDATSFAVARKEEVERVAQSAR
jgi:small subunit ribosomal protein S7